MITKLFVGNIFQMNSDYSGSQQAPAGESWEICSPQDGDREGFLHSLLALGHPLSLLMPWGLHSSLMGVEMVFGKRTDISHVSNRNNLHGHVSGSTANNRKTKG